MKKLIKKFVILAVISAVLGYKATKEVQQATKAEYAEQTPTVNAEKAVESETVDLFFQVVDKETANQNTEQPETVVEGTEKISEDVSADEPVYTPITEIREKAEAQEPVQPIINITIPSNTAEPAPLPTAIPTPHPTVEQTAIPETEPIPVPEPTPNKQFDIDYWVEFAKDYAQSIGLVLESSAVDCWDNPIPAGAHCNNIEQNITGRLNRYKNLEGFTDVWIWSEDSGNGSYDIYIGYA